MYLYPLWIRFWHLINAILFLLLVITGFSMHFSWEIIRFDLGITIHNVTGILLIISYGLFLFFHFLTGNWRHYAITRKDLTQGIRMQIRYYLLGVFRGHTNPFPATLERKFNPLQKTTYFLVIYLLLPLLIITGLGLFFPQTVIQSLWGVSGLHLTAMIHTLAGFFGILFLMVHLYFCTMGATAMSGFSSIITGYHRGD
ncbi:MAG: cytochrome B [Bacteroidetes bacterium]|nr:cytochrome B [Bacteroidota bacterium]